MIYTHVLENSRPGIESPADRLARIESDSNLEQPSTRIDPQ
jgi:hypothetical protein